MNKRVLLTQRQGVAVGAHPSLPDRQGLGRREMAMANGTGRVSFINSPLFSKPIKKNY